MTLREHLSGVANAIRKQTGSNDRIPASEFASKISQLKASDDLIGYRKYATFPAGSGSRSVSIAFDNFKSIKYVVTTGLYNYTDSGETMVSRCRIGTVNSSEIKITGNSVSLTHSFATDSDTTVTVFAFGVKA